MTRTVATAVALAALLSACSRGGEPDRPADNGSAAAAPEEPGTAASGWDLQSSGEGVALALLGSDGDAELRLFCPSGAGRLLVNVRAFRPVGSEERLSFGGGGEVVALVADSAGDPARGGVTGQAAVPADLGALIDGPISASYGAQSSGPHPAPPPQQARAFAAACLEGERPPGPTPAPVAPAAPDSQPASACRVEGGRPVPANRIRAIGTEPFWGARIDGRCVTYSTPEDQSGTRIWTKFAGTAESGSWIGFFAGQRFDLRTRPAPGCSDGMSDNRYPIAVTLTVAGEQRTGCAEPL